MQAPHVITRSNTQGHLAVLYESPQERLKLLASYFQEGVARNEMCVLVTSEHIDEVLEDFLSLGFDAKSAVDTGALRIFEAEQTYLPDGTFVSGYMLENVRNFLDEASSLGYDGLRTAGEMSWISVHPESIAEAIHYESDVNSICDAHQDFVGLCLYPAQQTSAGMLRDVMQTHPSFVHNGAPQLSPYYA
ncbi:MAG: histidine kinase [Candidatus Saccharibacteria bacterium]|nr:histidine kinase [Candidatus Saccharibacteria bacterium]